METNTSFSSLSIKEWDQNEVSIEVTVHADAQSEDQAQEMFERAEVRLMGDQYRVLVESKKASKWSTETTENLSIQIVIFAPQNAKLEIDHDFGSAAIGNFTNQAKIKVSFGSLEIENLTHPQSQVKSENGECLVKNVLGGQLNVAFGNLEIMQLTGSVTLKGSYSHLKIHSITQSAEVIEVRNEFGSVDLTLAFGTSYRIEARSEFGAIELPNEASITRSVKEFTSHMIEAIIGENPKGEIIVDSSFGELSIDID